MKSLLYYLKKAQEQHFAIPQFNFSDFSQLKAIVEKCKDLKSPAILGTSEGESKFFGLDEAVALRNVLRKKTGLPIFLNLDHGKSFSAQGGPASGWEYIKQAIDAGYDMVHFDGSKLSLEENIKISKEVIKYAKWRGVLVEGEVGQLGTDSSKIYTENFVIKEENLTKPEQAKEYVKKTGVDLLAISIGNFHGIEASGMDPNLRLDVLNKIKKEVGNAFLVLHGGSGTQENDIKETIKSGIVKININTELRVAFSGTLKRVLDANSEETTPYKYLPAAQKSVAKVVALKIGIFGSANKV
jgi:fructose-bisphosphate aldolase class II